MPRVLHYLNQFFAGFGGEEQAGLPPRLLSEPAGPGRLLQTLLGEQATLIGTLVCGDNYLQEERETALEALGAILDEQRPDLLVAGPAFNSGRYGLACATVCQLAMARQIPAVTGMHPENPALADSARRFLVVPTSARSDEMKDALTRTVAIGQKLLRGEALGPAAVEGYLPRGIRLNVLSERTAAERAVAMLHGRLRGETVASEIPLNSGEQVRPAAPIPDLREAVIAIVTEAGIVPKGNPLGFSHVFCGKWGTYSVAGLDELPAGLYEAVHGGYDGRFVNADPDRIVPVDIMRELEREGQIKALHDTVYVTVGNGTPVAHCARFGAEMAAALRAAGVAGAIVPST